MTAKKFVAGKAPIAAASTTRPAASALQQADIPEKEAVCAMLEMKKRCLKGLVLRKEFPPPVQLARKVCWSRQALDQWRNIMFAPQLVWVSG